MVPCAVEYFNAAASLKILAELNMLLSPQRDFDNSHRFLLPSSFKEESPAALGHVWVLMFEEKLAAFLDFWSQVKSSGAPVVSGYPQTEHFPAPHPTTLPPAPTTHWWLGVSMLECLSGSFQHKARRTATDAGDPAPPLPLNRSGPGGI